MNCSEACYWNVLKDWHVLYWKGFQSFTGMWTAHVFGYILGASGYVQKGKEQEALMSYEPRKRIVIRKIQKRIV